MIEARNIIFDYPGTRALDDVSFSIREGSITALVGPNGAGKTTLLRCLAALDEPVSGNILIGGVSVLSDPRQTHRLLGYLSDSFGLYEELSVRQCLLYSAMSHAIPKNRHHDMIELCAERLGITDRLNMKAGSLSRGQGQRLAIAQAIIHDPKILLLDEPASGLDPEARHSLADLFRKLRDSGMTLMVSSHILAELDEYSTDMLVLRKGKIIEHSSLSSAKDIVMMEIRISSQLQDLQKIIEDEDGTGDVVASESTACFSFSPDPDEQHRLLEGLLKKGLKICSFTEQQQNMHEAYLKTVRNDSAKENRI